MSVNRITEYGVPNVAANLTIEDKLSLEVVSVAATGSDQAGAAALTGAPAFNVTAGNGTKGVVLPAAVANGPIIRVYNNSGSNLKVYPASGDDINDGTADAAVTVAANTFAVFESLDTSTWAANYSGGTNSTLTGTEELTNKTITAQVVKTGLTASGSASNDFSASTGTFKTSSGANTISGDATLAAGKDLSCAAGDTAVDLSLGTGIFKSTTGLNTLSGYAALKTNATPVAAAGTDVSNAGSLASANFAKVSSDGATKGVKLPTGVAGQFQIIENTSSTALELYAASGGTVNGLTADASVVIPASKGVLCLCFAADTWIVYDLPAKATAS